MITLSLRQIIARSSKARDYIWGFEMTADADLTGPQQRAAILLYAEHSKALADAYDEAASHIRVARAAWGRA